MPLDLFMLLCLSLSHLCDAALLTYSVTIIIIIKKMLGQILTKTFFCGKMTKQKQVNLIAVRHISLRLSLQKCAILHLNKIPGKHM